MRTHVNRSVLFLFLVFSAVLTLDVIAAQQRRFDPIGCIVGTEEFKEDGITDFRKPNFANEFTLSHVSYELSLVFHLHPRLLFYDDGEDRNAFAFPDTIVLPGEEPPPPQDGFRCSLVMGERLYKQISRADDFDADNERKLWTEYQRVAGVLAHEFGHLAQYRMNLFVTEVGREHGKRPELHADYLAGWYIKYANRHAQSRNAQRSGGGEVWPPSCL